ncbi:MAG: SGNH/GDSL hydrolase family protein [Muribaculaceae bacterium]|nr:SGNH/GDSL hydrolase family protein [Muribaculaceae bacterium]
MKSHYTGLWLLLSLALVLFLLIAFSDMEIGIGEWKMKKAPFREALLGKGRAESDSLLSLSEVEGFDIDDVAEKPVATDSLPKSILLFGDSMTFNLALRLAAYAAYNGHQMHAVNWDSSNTKIWADCDTLLHYIKEYKADYVFISLGSNEIYYKKPEVRLPYVNRILEMLDTIPYVWIGPPNWKEDSGINDMLERTCRRGSFFRSAGMEFERKKDKIHPTREASALWMDSIMRWMPKSSHPILAELPPDTLGKHPVNVIFLKARHK